MFQSTILACKAAWWYLQRSESAIPPLLLGRFSLVNLILGHLPLQMKEGHAWRKDIKKDNDSLIGIVCMT